MDFNIKLDPKHINDEITRAIAKSAIGEQLEATIKKQVNEFSTSYANPLGPIVSREISNVLRKVIQENYMPKIEEFVKKNLTEKFTNDLLERMWEKFNYNH